MSDFDDWHTEAIADELYEYDTFSEVAKFAFNAGAAAQIEKDAASLSLHNLDVRLACKDFCYTPEGAALLLQALAAAIRAQLKVKT